MDIVQDRSGSDGIPQDVNATNKIATDLMAHFGGEGGGGFFGDSLEILWTLKHSFSCHFFSFDSLYVLNFALNFAIRLGFSGILRGNPGD